jgi:protein arginine kinase activator
MALAAVVPSFLGTPTMQKCQRCQNPATLHITEIMGADKFEEVHLCEQCAPKYFQEGQQKAAPGKALTKEAVSEGDEGTFGQQECPNCGLKFVEFRNSGRLGCPHDYQAFKDDLLPLLENIHGETRHVGKTPRRYPQTKKTEQELTQLRGRLKQAVTREDYEEAAKLRDRIRELEES